MKISKIQIILAAAAILWMGVIFAFSAQNAEKSSRESGKITEVIIRAAKPAIEKLDKQKQIHVKSMISFAVRKCAHFTEYLILGVILAANAVCMMGNRHMAWLIAWLVSAAYAASDEFHQMFSDGRSPQIRDVCIDASGAAAGIAVFIFVIYIIRKSRQEDTV